MNHRILVVDDDPSIRRSLARALAEGESEVRVVETAEEAIAALDTLQPGLLLTDVRLPGMDGLELLRLVRSRLPDTAVVLMTAFDDLPTVALAMREGAADFLVKPLDLHQLRGVIARLLEDRARAEAAWGHGEARESELLPVLVGRDPAMVSIFKVVGQAAASRAHVVIRGESGTGKELIARAIHASSRDAPKPFVAVNCTALPSTLLESELFGHRKGAFTGATADRKGRIAQAGDGTLFLDEIGDTTPEFQAKLLRVLQEKEYYPVGSDRPERTEARVVAATHRNLEEMMGTGEFREDLYYRLRVVEIHVPPLRKRPADVPLLAEHFIRKAAQALARKPPVLVSEALEALIRHSWPGNVRELENCLTRAVVLSAGGVIRPDDLALDPASRSSTEERVSPQGFSVTSGVEEHIPNRPPPKGVSAETPRPVSGGRQDGSEGPQLWTLTEVERDHVTAVLRHTRGRKAAAARLLGISRPRLDRLIEKHGLVDVLPPTHRDPSSGPRRKATEAAAPDSEGEAE